MHEEIQKANDDENDDIRVVPISGILETTIPRKSVYELPGGKMAKIVHKGSYAECSPTYEKLSSWIAEKGIRITGLIYEVYFNNPREVLPEEILTEIYAPVD